MGFFKRLALWSYSFSVSMNASDEFLIVSGADSTHYKSLDKFLSSLFRHEKNIKVIVFDLGLAKSERLALQDRFPAIELRTFRYSEYPDYFDIKVKAGEYAWKPVIIYDVLNEFKCCVCWMDAGNVVTQPLSEIRKITKKIGMYSPGSSGNISRWTHPKTLEYLKASGDLLDKHNLNGACVAVRYKNPKARDLVSKWKQYALTRDCIAPEGSSRKNHRQDQAVLSVIAHQSGITENMPKRYYGFKIHQDIR